MGSLIAKHVCLCRCTPIVTISTFRVPNIEKNTSPTLKHFERRITPENPLCQQDG